MSTEELQNTPENVNPDIRYTWRLADDTDYKVDPRTCFERTAEKTDLKFIGSKDVLPETSIIFSIPTYHREWTQGNIQKQIYELLRSDVPDAVGAIEVNYVLNELSERRWGNEGAKVLNEFLDEEKTTQRELVYDFSGMSRRDFLDYRDAEFGVATPYPDYLYKKDEDGYYEDPDKARKADEIVRVNDEMVHFFTDLAKVQNLGRALQEAEGNPTAHAEILKNIGDIIDSYGSSPDIQEIMKLGYAKASQVNITMLNTLNADFTAEGYAQKNFPQIRAIGADYAVERTKGLPNQDQVIFQMWDCDLIPSPNFYEELADFYKREKVDIAAIPTGGLTSPGTSKELFMTSSNSMLWITHMEGYKTESTPQISFNIKVLKEMGGITGAPQFEDRKTGTRLEKYKLLAHPEQYAKKVTTPPIAVFIHDKPGYVDASHRAEDTLKPGETVDSTVSEFLTEDGILGIFRGEEGIRGYLELLHKKEIINNGIRERMKKSGLNLNDYMDRNKEDQKLWFENYYDQEEQDFLKSLLDNPDLIQEMNEQFHKNLAVYNEMYDKQAQQNSVVVKQILRGIKSGNIDLGADPSDMVKDAGLIPEAIRFPLVNYLKSNSGFIRSLTAEDLQYLEYLVGVRTDCPLEVLNQFQQSLREYVGVPVDAEELYAESYSYKPASERPAEDKRAYLYAASSLRLAATLTKTNFVKQMTDPTPENIEFSTHYIDKKPVMADYADRTKWYSELFAQKEE